MVRRGRRTSYVSIVQVKIFFPVGVFEDLSLFRKFLYFVYAELGACRNLLRSEAHRKKTFRIFYLLFVLSFFKALGSSFGSSFCSSFGFSL